MTLPKDSLLFSCFILSGRLTADKFGPLVLRLNDIPPSEENERSSFVSTSCRAAHSFRKAIATCLLCSTMFLTSVHCIQTSIFFLCFRRDKSTAMLSGTQSHLHGIFLPYIWYRDLLYYDNMLLFNRLKTLLKRKTAVFLPWLSMPIQPTMLFRFGILFHHGRIFMREKEYLYCNTTLNQNSFPFHGFALGLFFC